MYGSGILVCDEDPTQGLDDITIVIDTRYSINFSRSNRIFVSGCDTMEAPNFYLLMLQKYINADQKILK